MIRYSTLFYIFLGILTFSFVLSLINSYINGIDTYNIQLEGLKVFLFFWLIVCFINRKQFKLITTLKYSKESTLINRKKIIYGSSISAVILILLILSVYQGLEKTDIKDIYVYLILTNIFAIITFVMSSIIIRFKKN